MLAEICLENVKELKIEIDWKNKKINYSKLEFFDTPEERRVKKEEYIRNRIIEYIKKQGGSCTLRLTRTIRNKEAEREREDIFKFLGCRQIDVIAQQLYSLLKEEKVFRYRLRKNNPFVYSFEPILKQKLLIQKPEKKIDKIKEKILEYIKQHQPCTFRFAGTKESKPTVVSLTFSRRKNYKKSSDGIEESRRIKAMLETNNNKTIGRALKELVEEGKVSRERNNEHLPYLYSISADPEEKKISKEKVHKVKVNRICSRCGSTMKLNRDEEGIEFLYCLLCSERIYL